MKGTIKDFILTRDGDCRITLSTKEDITELFDELKDGEIDFTIKKHKEKRSLDANAYMWVLIGKLAEKTKLPREDIYKEAIRNVGGNYDTVCVTEKALETLVNGWEHNGAGWITETFPSKLKGCTNVNLFYGSSVYDTEHMSRLVDIIVQECHEQGIPTETPDEIENLKSLWKGH